MELAFYINQYDIFMLDDPMALSYAYAVYVAFMYKIFINLYDTFCNKLSS